MSNNRLSDEDLALFRAAMKTVKPLHSKAIPQGYSRPLPQISMTSTPSHPKHYALSSSSHTPVEADTTLAYKPSDFPLKRWRQLKAGLIPYEGRLDLHGCTQTEAQEHLINFIENQIYLHKRCLLIIHGKGSRHGEAPVLKNLINTWLKQLPQVLAFHSAISRHGGNGAVYVLLKKS